MRAKIGHLHVIESLDHTVCAMGGGRPQATAQAILRSFHVPGASRKAKGEMTGVTPGATEKLPPGLSRLPADKLVKVHQALVELEQAGLSEVPDLAHLSKVVRCSEKGLPP